MPLTVVILAGGRSRRMGTDKAQIELQGESLLSHVVSACLEVSLPVLVVGREQPQGWSVSEVEFIPDLLPDSGPLGGLQAALRHHNGSVLLTACDMPLLTGDALKWLAGQVNFSDKDGLAVVNRGALEPLFSIYALACLPLVEQCLETGNLSLRRLIEAGQFSQLEAPDWISNQLVNVNTPEDLAQILVT